MRFAFLLLTFLWLGNLSAQDIHFAHIHASPLVLNPAMTGLINNGNVRLIANARTQWHSVTNGYKTVAGSIDGKVFDLTGRNYIGGGLQLIGDRAGDLGFSKNAIEFSVSGLKALDRKGHHYVTVGLRGANHFYSVDYSKMVGFDNEPLVDAGAPDRFSFFDVSAGVAWYYHYNRFNTVYLGGAVFHLGEPNTSFFNRTDSDLANAEAYGYEKLYRKVVVHGGGNFKLSGIVTVLPSFIFMDQGPHREINMGSFVKFLKDRNTRHSETAFYLGGWFRYHLDKGIAGTDAVIAAVRADIRNTYITFSFDFNLSTLSVASYGAGGPELSVIQILTVPKDRRKSERVKCPAF